MPSTKFDPYHLWLGIPPSEQPPNHYRLLGIRRFEDNLDVIAGAADRQMAHLKTFQTSSHSAASQRLLGEVTAAKLCLLASPQKLAYDEKLRARTAGRTRKPGEPKLLTAKPLSPNRSDVAVSSARKKSPSPVGRRQAAPTLHRTAVTAEIESSRGIDLVVDRKIRNRKQRRWLLTGLIGGFAILAIAVASVLDTMMHRLTAPEIAKIVPTSNQAQALPGKGHKADLPLSVPRAVDVKRSTPQAEIAPIETNFPPDSTKKEDAAISSRTQPPVDETAATSPSEDTTAVDSPGIESNSHAGAEPPESAGVVDESQTISSATTQWQAEHKNKSHDRRATDDSLNDPNSRASTLLRDPTRPKFAVPSIEVQKESQALFRDTFHNELDAANSSEKRIALARKLLDTAVGFQPGEPSRYVMFVKAGELAADAPDDNLIVKAADLMASEYGIDGLNLKVELLQRAGKARATTTTQESLVKAMLKTIDDAAAVDQLDVARELVSSAKALAQKTRSHTLVAQVNDCNNQIHEQGARYTDVLRALDTLAQQPTDPSANSVVGAYRCFYKGEWEVGLPLLTQCDDADLAKLAKRSLTSISDLPELVEIGDLWWQHGEMARGRERQRQHAWACTWYKQALPAAQGLVKTKLAKRIEETEGKKPQMAAQPVQKKHK